MRIMSLGYTPVNQSNQNHKKQQNPAFTGTLESIIQNLEVCPDFKSRTSALVQKMVINTLTTVSVAYEKIGEKGLKAVLTFDKGADAYAERVAKGYSDCPPEQKVEGLSIIFTR